MYSPLAQGESFVFTGQVFLDTGAPLPLAGASGQLVFAPVAGSPVGLVRFVGSGTWAVTDASSGSYSYTASAGDITKLLAGDWIVQAVLTLASGQTRYTTPVGIRWNLPV